MRTIILLSGWKRSGKDTAAAYLQENYNFNKLALADALKEFVCSKYNMDMNYFSDKSKDEWLPMKPAHLSADDFSQLVYKYVSKELAYDPSDERGKEEYFTPRTLAILEGALMRAINPHHWTDAVARKIERENYSTVVISDWRFANECYRLRELFGSSSIITVRVNRFNDVSTDNETERQLDNFAFDHTINNTGTIENLFTELDILVNKEFGGGK